MPRWIVVMSGSKDVVAYAAELMGIEPDAVPHGRTEFEHDQQTYEVLHDANEPLTILFRDLDRKKPVEAYVPSGRRRRPRGTAV